MVRFDVDAVLLYIVPLAEIAVDEAYGNCEAVVEVALKYGASTKAYEAANAKMHKDMAITYSGDADRDFLAGMIPHHQGAIDMARVVLRHGKDPEMKRLAESIIAAQEAEIAQLRAFLAR